VVVAAVLLPLGAPVELVQLERVLLPRLLAFLLGVDRRRRLLLLVGLLRRSQQKPQLRPRRPLPP
jgi:hypothetical protein